MRLFAETPGRKTHTVACLALFSLYGCSQADRPEDNLRAELQIQAEPLACSPETSPGIDCDCVETIVAENWHDDADLDAQTLMDSDSTDMSQAAIDAVMDLAVDSDKRCTVVSE